MFLNWQKQLNVLFTITWVAFFLIIFTTQVFAKAPTEPPSDPGFKAENALYVGKVNTSGSFAVNLGSVISTVLSAIMAIGGLGGFIYIIWGSVEWITSGGEKGKVEEGRNKIIQAVIGFFVLGCCYAVFKVVISLLGFDTLTDVLNGIQQIKVDGR